jgi:hypothetical protein
VRAAGGYSREVREKCGRAVACADQRPARILNFVIVRAMCFGNQRFQGPGFRYILGSTMCVSPRATAARIVSATSSGGQFGSLHQSARGVCNLRVASRVIEKIGQKESGHDDAHSHASPSEFVYQRFAQRNRDRCRPSCRCCRGNS